MHMICLSEIPGMSEIVKIEKIEYFQISSLNVTQAYFTLGANIGQVQKRPENKKMSLFLDFDDFRYLEADKQAKHMHMHMICLSEILGISEIDKIEKIEYFQISSLTFTQA